MMMWMMYDVDDACMMTMTMMLACIVVMIMMHDV